MAKKIYHQDVSFWYVERVVFLAAGSFITTSTIFSLSGHFNFQYFTLLVGVMLINFSLTGYCPLAIITSRLGLKEK